MIPRRSATAGARPPDLGAAGENARQNDTPHSADDCWALRAPGRTAAQNKPSSYEEERTRPGEARSAWAPPPRAHQGRPPRPPAKRFMIGAAYWSGSAESAIALPLPTFAHQYRVAKLRARRQIKPKLFKLGTGKELKDYGSARDARLRPNPPIEHWQRPASGMAPLFLASAGSEKPRGITEPRATLYILSQGPFICNLPRFSF
ncbi:hypothetical protein TraAM80_09052 [Trypanosoma rangeli]|uniref:Uncharacterized protein n=1 Tax=Trypanosoma rangeli TaxID=5698 RepID=A0A422MXM5_TRYRA|nr:uncharacterized protein TraAM80_09052 [Trypanosoma rangeli]RNE97930.1 hypothetical protein TraAM80_09052 [Trypanosoma rangeli]|eukprot:RNE97930.1 hypothetical protein TraAM80_09052 [Trypanosoma rangeli]